MTKALILALLACAASACATGGTSKPPSQPSPPSGKSPPPPEPPAPSREGGPWTTRVYADHPLVGRIYRPGSGAFSSRRELEAAAQRAHFVLLGEKHDNPDHHRLQLALLDAVLSAGRKPALVFEMLDTTVQPAIDSWRESGSNDPDGFAGAVAWNERGWDWPMYRPLIGRGLSRQLPIVAANMPRTDARAIVMQGPEAPVLRPLTLPELPPDQLGALEGVMRTSHCGELPEVMIPGMMLVQRARDAIMASQLRRAADRGGAVLIAGAGHVRGDRGVPVALGAAPSDVLIVTMLEVQADASEPEAYLDRTPAGRHPYDFVWFTPRLDDDDPCEKLRGHFRNHPRKSDAGSDGEP